MALVRRRETTVEELRRVAAEPVRMVAEPLPRSEPPRLRIGWLEPSDDAPAPPILAQLTEAAATLGGHIEIVPTTVDSPGAETLDALVVDELATGRGDRSPALVVALATNAAVGEQVGALARDADLVVPRVAHGRFLLATILALLRWRSRE
jgi:hypothetical protein